MARLLKVIKKIVNYLYTKGVFDCLNNQKTFGNHEGVLQGDDCVIDQTALIITSKVNKLILNGKNYVANWAYVIPSKNGINIGFGTSIQKSCVLLGDIEIGKHCLLAPNIFISSGKHHYDFSKHLYIKEQDLLYIKENGEAYSNKVIVYDDVWIGVNSVIMDGVKIGKGSVIAANSVVTKSVEPYSIMAGSPAKMIKKRVELERRDYIFFNDETAFPYFYQGFLLEIENRQKWSETGGVACMGYFQLYHLAAGDRLELKIKSLTGSNESLVYGEEKQKVRFDDFTNVVFSMLNVDYHEFKSLEGGSGLNEIFLISEIKVS